MVPRVRDLFGMMPVTMDDVEAWLLAVPGIDPGSPRAAWYTRAYDVPGKIERAKLAGLFDEIVTREPPRLSGGCGFARGSSAVDRVALADRKHGHGDGSDGRATVES